MGYSMGYNYNGKLKSAEILLKEDGSFELIVVQKHQKIISQPLTVLIS